MKVRKPKVCLFVRAGVYRGSRGFWKRPYGRPEGPNRYGTLAKLKAMVRISKSKSPPPQPPQPRKRGRWEERSSREEGPVVEKRQGRHSAARGVKKRGREPCRDLWCGSGEDKEQGREPCRDLWCGSGEDKSRERSMASSFRGGDPGGTAWGGAASPDGITP